MARDGGIRAGRPRSGGVVGVREEAGGVGAGDRVPGRGHRIGIGHGLGRDRQEQDRGCEDHCQDRAGAANTDRSPVAARSEDEANRQAKGEDLTVPVFDDEAAQEFAAGQAEAGSAAADAGGEDD